MFGKPFSPALSLPDLNAGPDTNTILFHKLLVCGPSPVLIGFITLLVEVSHINTLASIVTFTATESAFWFGSLGFTLFHKGLAPLLLFIDLLTTVIPLPPVLGMVSIFPSGGVGRYCKVFPPCPVLVNFRALVFVVSRLAAVSATILASTVSF